MCVVCPCVHCVHVCVMCPHVCVVCSRVCVVCPHVYIVCVHMCVVCPTCVLSTCALCPHVCCVHVCAVCPRVHCVCSPPWLQTPRGHCPCLTCSSCTLSPSPGPGTGIRWALQGARRGTEGVGCLSFCYVSDSHFTLRLNFDDLPVTQQVEVTGSMQIHVLKHYHTCVGFRIWGLWGAIRQDLEPWDGIS